MKLIKKLNGGKFLYDLTRDVLNRSKKYKRLDDYPKLLREFIVNACASCPENFKDKWLWLYPPFQLVSNISEKDFVKITNKFGEVFDSGNTTYITQSSININVLVPKDQHVWQLIKLLNSRWDEYNISPACWIQRNNCLFSNQTIVCKGDISSLELSNKIPETTVGEFELEELVKKAQFVEEILLKLKANIRSIIMAQNSQNENSRVIDQHMLGCAGTLIKDGVLLFFTHFLFINNDELFFSENDEPDSLLVGKYVFYYKGGSLYITNLLACKDIVHLHGRRFICLGSHKSLIRKALFSKRPEKLFRAVVEWLLTFTKEDGLAMESLTDLKRFSKSQRSIAEMSITISRHASLEDWITTNFGDEAEKFRSLRELNISFDRRSTSIEELISLEDQKAVEEKIHC